jgi:large subunit ribosomal protein L18
MSKLTKSARRKRRALKHRAKIRSQGKARLTVYRSANHIYAQVIDDSRGHTLASASTLDRELREGITHGGNTEAARKVGQAIAERAKEAGVSEIAFDRSGYKYHGRVQALAEAARDGGLPI